MPSHLKMRSLTVGNFKGIAKLDLPLDESMTLLAGVNGVGKTSAIQALLAAVSATLDVFDLDVPTSRFRPLGDLVRYGAAEGKVRLKLELAEDVEVVSEAPVSAEIQSPLVSSPLHPPQLMELASPIPLVVHYDQNRIGGLASERHLTSFETNRHAALDTTAHTLSDFKNWYFKRESDEARTAIDRNDLEYEDRELQAVREVLKGIAGKSALLRSRMPPGSMNRMLFLRKAGGFDIPFDALSGGEQAYFLLAVDLARRLLLEFPGRSLAEAPGIVCIDEIELHLHPAWQRAILTSLMDAFPNCQFVVSSHSPQVIGSVSAHHVRLLRATENDGQISVTTPIATKGRDSNYVLEGVLDTPEQDPGVDDLFTKFDQLIDEGAFEEAERILDDLDACVEGGSPQIAIRRAKSKRLQMGSG